jgi:glycosyltransferase involved in cell wall biosynthesis
MNWKKNILTVLEGCARLRAEGVKFHLILAGQGPDMKEIERKINSLGLHEMTYLAGHVTDAKLLDGLYSRATVFAFPSLYDAAPMVVREAAVMGTPSVMVRGSTAAEIIRDGENGYLCQNDPADLARVMTEALSDRQALERVGECARQTIPVPWERTMEKAVERYTRLAALGKEGKLNKKSLRVI